MSVQSLTEVMWEANIDKRSTKVQLETHIQKPEPYFPSMLINAGVEKTYNARSMSAYLCVFDNILSRIVSQHEANVSSLTGQKRVDFRNHHWHVSHDSAFWEFGLGSVG